MAEFSASDSEGEIYEVEQILDSRKTGRTNEYLVKWRNFDESYNSWEPQRNLNGAKEVLQAYLKAQKTPAKLEPKSVKKVTTATKTLGGSTVTKTVTTTTTKADLSSPESSPVLRRRTVETTKTVTVSSGNKKRSKGSNMISRLWATILAVPRPIMVQIICLLIIFGTFIPLK